MALTEGVHRLGPGLAVATVISALAFLMARVPALMALGMSALTIAIVLGALFGNIGHRVVTGPRAQRGLQFAQKTLLRLGLALYGLNLSFPQILQVGPAAIVADLFIVSSTILVGWWVGLPMAANGPRHGSANLSRQWHLWSGGRRCDRIRARLCAAQDLGRRGSGGLVW